VPASHGQRPARSMAIQAKAPESSRARRNRDRTPARTHKEQGSEAAAARLGRSEPSTVYASYLSPPNVDPELPRRASSHRIGKSALSAVAYAAGSARHAESGMTIVWRERRECTLMKRTRAYP